MNFCKRFSFYGLTVEVLSDNREIVDEVGRDFAWFVVKDMTTPSVRPDLQIELKLESPPWATLPAIRASVITPRNVTFRNGEVTYVDYFGRGLAVINRGDKTCLMYSPQFDMLREMAYLYLLSTVGQHFDSLGLHRIHALGVAHGGRGMLLLLPSGGGKSTMSLELLGQDDFTLLSEDTPLIDRKGMMHPFPLRLGVRGEKAREIPAHLQRTFDRMEFDRKTFVDVEFFRERIGSSVPVSMILVGERNLGDVSRIEPLSRRATFNALLKYFIIGLGVYQGLEFLLEKGILDMSSKLGVFASRTRNGIALMRHARAWKIVLGRDQQKNAATLMKFVRESTRSP
jgi:hypothetical protein